MPQATGVLAHVTIKPLNVEKKKGTIQCGKSIVIYYDSTAECDNGTIKCEKKNKGTFECDKRTVTYDVGTTQCDNRTVKCEKKKLRYY